MLSKVKLGAIALLTMMATASAPALTGAALAQAGGKSGIIETETLAPLDAWGVSALGRGEAGLPRTLWRNADAANVTSQMQFTPAVLTGPTSWHLLRDVLAAPTDAPKGEARLSARQRVETLARLGAAEEVLALSVGPLRDDIQVMMFAAQAELALGRTADACRRIASLEEEDAPPFVLRMRAVCLAVNGDVDSALLALEVASAKGAGDPWLAGALRALAATPAGAAPSPPPATTKGRPNPPALITARYDTSLNAAVSNLARLPPSRETGIPTASLFALRAVVGSEAPALTVRAEAAVRLSRLGRLAPEQTRAILRAAQDPTVRTPPRLVVLVRDLDAALDPAVRARLLVFAIDASTNAGDAALVFRIAAPEVRALLGEPGLSIGATSLARAALAAGDIPTAKAYRAMADRQRSDARAIASLDAALAIVQNANPNDLRFAAERRAEAGGPGALRDVLALAAMGAPLSGAAESLTLGAPLEPAISSRDKKDPRLAETETRLGLLALAVQRRSTGEIALLTGVLLSEGPQRLGAQALAEVLKALAGTPELQRYGRQAAVEALLASPPPTASAANSAAPARKR
jgi:hypothetical protein